MWHLQVVLLLLQFRALGLQQGLQLLEVGLALHQLALPGIQPLLLLTYPLRTRLSYLQPSTEMCGLQHICACTEVAKLHRLCLCMQPWHRLVGHDSCDLAYTLPGQRGMLLFSKGGNAGQAQSKDMTSIQGHSVWQWNVCLRSSRQALTCKVLSQSSILV